MADSDPEQPVESPVDSPAPAPVSNAPTTDGSFEDFALSDEVRRGIAALGYERPTDVQAAVIEPALAGTDLQVQAQTGSGKTAAFGIPLIQRIEVGGAAAGAPHGLVLTPTRELANQVANELRSIGAQKGIRVCAVYGGVSITRQADDLRDGVEIVVGTPGRLLDHIRRRNLTLSDMRTICLDEADEMLSMGFWDDVTDMLKQAPDTCQTMLFSATLPYQVAKAAASYLKDPARLDLSGDEVTVQAIENVVVHVLPEIPKPRQLLYVLETEQPDSAIVFCNTRNETDMIARYLTQSGFVAEPISGNFRQNEREAVMGRIKSGELRYMIATDVASRGIDISDLSHVLNYSLPEFPEVYVHRVGRTGRLGKVGTAISLVDGKGIGTLSVLERQFNIGFNERELPPEDEILKRRSQRIMKELADKASVAEVGQHLEVAKEILSSDDGAQTVAFLLKSYFNAQASGRRPNRSEGRSEGRSDGRSDNRGEGRKQERSRDGGSEGETGTRRRRRRRRRRRPNQNESASTGGYDTLDANEALAGSGGLPPPANPAAGESKPESEIPSDMARVRVNIGFDDGFKGRGAVAKKIAALAGLNDGIVTEVESKRDYAVLQASSDIAELLVERVDGAQIGKKIVSVAATQ